MKIVLIVTLVVASSIYLVNALAGPSQNPSSTVEREASQLFSSVELRGGTQANSLLRYIQVRASMYNREFVGLKNRVGEQLSRLGNDGREIRTQLNSEAQKLVDSVREEVSTENLKPKLLAIISSWSQFAEPIQTDIAYLVSAIDASSENVKCWDENKGDLGSFINNLLSETQNIIWEELRQLNSQIEDVAASINNEVTQLEEKLQSECINNRSCYVNYFNKNMPGLLHQLSTFQVRISSHINEAISSIHSNTSALFKEAMSTDYNGIKQKIKQCIK